jgi:membrane protein
MNNILPNLLELLKLSYEGWKADKASRLAAALAYYTIFSLAPLLVIVIALAGLIWQRDVVQAQVIYEVQSLVGSQGAEFVSELLTSVSNPAEGILATTVGIATLLVGALGVFNELHNALNTIWGISEEKPKSLLDSIKKVIVDRFLSFTMILGIGFLLLVSLVVSAVISATQEMVGNAFPIPESVLQMVNLLISIGVITVLFAFLFKFLPDVKIAWRDVWMGAFVTALLFSLGKTLIGLYLGNSAITSSFGAAGSLALLLVWVYYSAQIMFFGAEFTQVYANKYGSKINEEQALLSPQPSSTGLESNVRTAPAAASMAILKREYDLEVQNRQVARFLLGLTAVSFFTGALTSILGFKRR